MKASRIVVPVAMGVGAGILVALVGGCQPNRGYYEERYDDERVITPTGVGDTMAVYRTSAADEAARVRTTTVAPVRDTTVVTEETSVVRREPSVVVVDRGAASPLRVEVITPASGLICEDIPVRFLVTNTSGMDAPDAYVQATLPPGLRVANGDTRVSMNVGLVPAGGTREITVPVRAERPGSFLSLTSVSTDPDVRTTAVETAMVVGQPVLNLVLEATEPSADSNMVIVNLRVSNTGNVEALNTTVNATLSPNARALDMERLTWDFGSLLPGESKEATVRLDAFQPGVVTGNATATARCAEAATASFEKMVR
ncbi:MAG TPA: hypothetical protein VD997_06905 [Phycisphaerales bacterium]|nr:hypothetical protein [Phycisphaerales bacterium]